MSELEPTARPRPAAGIALELWRIAADVVDPEVPVLSIEDLGVLRGARLEAEGPVIAITPTYSGCPAVATIAADIVAALADRGWPAARVEVVISPAWSSDWMSEAGRAKLAAAGIAPPCPAGCAIVARAEVSCPRCGGDDVAVLSPFGSTACKALYECRGCLEPFEHFKTF